MKTLKKRMSGEEVKTLQRALGVNADGIFGAMTEGAVKDFQRSRQLIADGIVGAKTWAALGVTENKCVDPSVVYLPLSVHVSRLPGRSIKYLAIHYTAGSSSDVGRARAVKHVFESRKASADFAVDDKEIVQFNPDILTYYCWAVGDKKAAGSIADACNRNTISIEICSNLKAGYSHQAVNHDGWFFTEAALNNAVKLAKILMHKFNIPIERVVRHYDISGKICPGVVGWNNYVRYDKNGNRTGKKNDSAAWLAFKKRLL